MLETTSCPRCQRKLSLPEEHFGKVVQCPSCHHSFRAAAKAAAPRIDEHDLDEEEAVEERRSGWSPEPYPVEPEQIPFRLASRTVLLTIRAVVMIGLALIAGIVIAFLILA